MAATRSRRVLRLVLGAEVLSMTGAQFSAIGMPWFALEITGSPADVGRVMAAQMIAVGVCGLAAASIAGRLGPRRSMIIADVARGPLVAAVPLLHLFGGLSLPLFMVLLFAVGCFFAPYVASQQSLLPAIVGDDPQALSRANASLQAATRLSILLGPPLAGLMIAWVGAGSALLLNAATYLLAAALLWWGLPPGLAGPGGEGAGRLLAGARVVVRDRLVRHWSVSQIVGEAAWQGLFVLIPVITWLRYHASPALAGAMLGAFGGGALLGNALVAPALRKWSGLRLAVVARIGLTLVFLLLLMPLTPIGFLVFLFAAGLFNGLSNPPMMAIRTARIPTNLRTTSITVIMAFALTGGTVGLIVATGAVEAFGFGWTFATLVALQSVATGFFLWGAPGGKSEPVGGTTW